MLQNFLICGSPEALGYREPQTQKLEYSIFLFKGPIQKANSKNFLSNETFWFEAPLWPYRPLCYFALKQAILLNMLCGVCEGCAFLIKICMSTKFLNDIFWPEKICLKLI